jgi:hypothetical protein
MYGVQVTQVNDHTQFCWITVCKTQECKKPCAIDGSGKTDEDVLKCRLSGQPLQTDFASGNENESWPYYYSADCGRI